MTQIGIKPINIIEEFKIESSNIKSDEYFFEKKKFLEHKINEIITSKNGNHIDDLSKCYLIFYQLDVDLLIYNIKKCKCMDIKFKKLITNFEYFRNLIHDLVRVSSINIVNILNQKETDDVKTQLEEKITDIEIKNGIECDPTKLMWVIIELFEYNSYSNYHVIMALYKKIYNFEFCLLLNIITECKCLSEDIKLLFLNNNKYKKFINKQIVRFKEIELEKKIKLLEITNKKRALLKDKL